MVEGGDVALAPSVARRVANALAEPIPDIAADPIIAGGSVGIAFGTPGRFDGEQLLAEDAAALYVAKRAGDGSAVAVAPTGMASAAWECLRIRASPPPGTGLLPSGSPRARHDSGQAGPQMGG